MVKKFEHAVRANDLGPANTDYIASRIAIKRLQSNVRGAEIQWVGDSCWEFIGLTVKIVVSRVLAGVSAKEGLIIVGISEAHFVDRCGIRRKSPIARNGLRP